ncbi:Rha family transcriptional regulator [Aerococcaceae bacterium NML191219]|nr:Rha family transcriptional regulator [Aerococcaceae bacterium NML191219]
MRAIIPKDDYGIFVDKNDIARVDSLFVADAFEKNHKEVLRDIRKLTELNSGLSKEFAERNFALGSYKDKQNQKRPCYYLTRDGFTMLVMGYTGTKAIKFKEIYIKRFNEMESFIQTLVNARVEFPLLTENIKLLHASPKPYHFSNESDLINRIAIGQSAKQFRLANGIDKGKSIRPYLTKEQIALIEVLQKVDVGLLVAFPNYEDRKKHLEWYKTKWEEEHGKIN